uniref:BTB domain-containing protein n=1 Tax=Panagrolaimus sp. ES5 TaxID=591445 RepID=A0AC34F658_9BILA
MDTIPKTKVKFPFALKWPIQESVLREMKENKPGKFLVDVSFSLSIIPDAEFYVYVYPNGVKEKGLKDITRIKLYIYHYTEIEADFYISIQTANYISEKIHFNDSSETGHCSIATKDFFDPEKKFFVGGKVTIKIEGTVLTEYNMLDEPIVSSSDSLCLGLWKHNEGKDFTVVVGKDEITAHKCVLAARSSVFRAMFQSGMKEAKENKVFIKDFDFNIVEAAIKSCYHQSLVEYTSLEDKLKLLQFFDKYDIQSLKDAFEVYLMSVVNEFTVVRLTNAALLSNVPKLETKCAEFLQDCVKNKAVADLDLLDKDFALHLFKNSFCHTCVVKL